jgi:hypothetical protein
LCSFEEIFRLAAETFRKNFPGAGIETLKLEPMVRGIGDNFKVILHLVGKLKQGIVEGSKAIDKN